MKKMAHGIVKLRFVIFIAALIMLIPTAICYMNTRINYDILSYLPEEIDTMKGQDIIEKEFGEGAFSLVVVENMPFKDVAKLEKDIEQVNDVKEVIWYDDFTDITLPAEILPDKIREAFISDDGSCTLLAVVYKTTMSADETMEAIDTIRGMVGDNVYVSGGSALTNDTKILSEKEAPIYVVMAVILCMIVLMLTLDSFFLPFLFLASIGIAIIYNMGTNLIFGEISYLTQAMAAILQLGVTLDYSIFLWHSFEEQMTLNGGNKYEAMEKAIPATFTSVIGSSITTIAGFIALCFMHFRIGLDIGLVMAKGVLFGVLSVLTILPSMILIFHKLIIKTKHKPLLPKFRHIPNFVQKYYPLLLVLFAVIWFPASYGYNHTQVYYNLGATLPDSLPSIQANNKLDEEFNMATTHLVLYSKDMDAKQVVNMSDEIKDVDGVKTVLGEEALLGADVPKELLPSNLRDMFEDGDWEMMMIMSEYQAATDDVNKQCDRIEDIIKKYDDNAMLVGEAPCTRDLINITNKDFITVDSVSIGIVAVIILLTLRSISLPVILVAAIEFAIFINLGIPCYTGTVLPFIASIFISTIQLGSTVDYAILMTTRYKVERHSGKSRREAVKIAHTMSIQSILVSAISFFAATFGVGLYSDIDIVSSMCILLARGALISMITVIFILPSLLLLCDRIIIHTSIGIKPKTVEYGDTDALKNDENQIELVGRVNKADSASEDNDTKNKDKDTITDVSDRSGGGSAKGPDAGNV